MDVSHRHLAFKDDKWRKHVRYMMDKDVLPQQLTCSHSMSKIPYSGYHFGIPVWRCIYCELHVQAS